MAVNLPSVRFNDPAQNRWAANVAQALRSIDKSAKQGANTQTIGSVGSGGSTGGGPSSGGQVQTPTIVTNFRALGGFSSIFLQWDMPTYNGHAFTRIYRAPTNNFGDAQPIADVGIALYSDAVGMDTGYYYWARNYNINDDKSPINQTEGTYASSALSYDMVIDDAIDDVMASLNIWQSDIVTAMDIIDNRTLQLVLNNGGVIDQMNEQLAVVTNNLTSQYDETVQAVANEIGTAITKIETFGSSLVMVDSEGNPRFDEDGKPILQGAFIDSVDATLATKDGKLMAAIGNTLSIQDEDTKYTLSEVMSLSLNVNKQLTAQWGVKTKVSDLLYGVGLVSYTDEFGQQKVNFNVGVNNFSIHNPANGTEIIPFIVDENDRVLMKTALIDKATITSLVTETIVTEELFAGKQIASPIINGGELHIGSYFDVDNTGEVTAANISIEDVLGNVLLSTKPEQGTFIDGAYITNLVVDTLQIADYAVTVPMAVETSEFHGTSFTILDLNYDAGAPGMMQFSLALECLRDGDVSGAYDTVDIIVKVYDDGVLAKTFDHDAVEIDGTDGDSGRKVWPLMGSYYCATGQVGISVFVYSNTPNQSIYATLRGSVSSAKK